MKDIDYYHELKEDNDLSDKTMEGYILALKKYTNFHKTTLHELLLEAEKEQININWMRQRQIKKRFTDFRKHLTKQNLKAGTINTTMSRIKSFYQNYELDTPDIKRLKVIKQETIHDIPTKDHIRSIVNGTGNLKHKALILFMSSSGTGTNETIRLRIKDFIQATNEYHNETEIRSVLEVLEKQEDIIPTWTFRRVKTNYQYYTFSSPESTRAIINFLNKLLSKHHNIKPTDRLFRLEQGGVKHVFREINLKHDYGLKSDDRHFIHAHAMRKFFATTLSGVEINDLPLENIFIEWMLGHSINETKEAYYKSNPAKLKKYYSKFVHELSIREVVIQDRTSAEIKEIVRDNEAKEQRILDLEEKDKIMGDLMRRVMEELDLEK